MIKELTKAQREVLRILPQLNAEETEKLRKLLLLFASERLLDHVDKESEKRGYTKAQIENFSFESNRRKTI